MQKTIFWKPQTGDKINGTLTEIKKDAGRYKSTLYKIRDENTTYYVWGKVQLDSIMQTAHIGDKIQLQYKGTEELEEFNMQRYELEILDE